MKFGDIPPSGLGNVDAGRTNTRDPMIKIALTPRAHGSDELIKPRT